MVPRRAGMGVSPRTWWVRGLTLMSFGASQWIRTTWPPLGHGPKPALGAMLQFET